MLRSKRRREREASKWKNKAIAHDDYEQDLEFRVCWTESLRGKGCLIHILKTWMDKRHWNCFGS